MLLDKLFKIYLSLLVQLEGKHTTQNAHCAVEYMLKYCDIKKKFGDALDFWQTCTNT